MLTFVGFNWTIIAGVAAAIVLLRWRKVGMFTWTLAWLIATLVFLRFAFEVPVPASVIGLYMAIVTGSLAAYITSAQERIDDFMRPIVKLVREPSYRPLLAAIVLLIPALAALNVYAKMNVPLEAPSFGRTVHPAPPSSITVHDNDISLVTADSPYRGLKHDDPGAYEAHVENGRRVYYQNCFYCHGDGMGGDGMFAHGLNPIPSNFNDDNVLPNLQESYIFWRVSKGAPGLPAEGGPWDSFMPAWEKFLTEEEMWDAALFLYEFNGYEPRAREEHH